MTRRDYKPPTLESASDSIIDAAGELYAKLCDAIRRNDRQAREDAKKLCRTILARLEGG